jgi:hypothetical protein
MAWINATIKIFLMGILTNILGINKNANKKLIKKSNKARIIYITNKIEDLLKVI